MTNITPQIRLVDGKPVTSSRELAVFFHKQHQHVTQKIEKIGCSDEFLTSNFSLVDYSHRGNTYKEYQITRDGFAFLAMGFTGKKAAVFKEAYINAFNLMEEQLQNQSCINLLPNVSGLTNRDRQNLKQAASVFIDGLTSKRPLFEIRALIQYLCRSASEFNWDTAIDDVLPFKKSLLVGLLTDNERAVVTASDSREISIQYVGAEAFNYLADAMDESPQLELGSDVGYIPG